MPRAPLHHVFLVPGFFGFVNIGRLVYFAHVREALEEAFGRRGLGVVVYRVQVPPTASLVDRASALRDFLAENLPVRGRDPVHLIGHSTGGLDARLLVTPKVELGRGEPVEPFARRVRSLVSVATPHRGTPLASLFTSVLGQSMLRLLSVATVEALRTGRIPASLVTRLARGLVGSWRPGTKTDALVEQLQAELVRALPPDHQRPIGEFLAEVARDQALLPQLTPEGIALFNASTRDRPSVRYGCVVTRAPVPGLRARLKAGPGPYHQATYTLFEALHRQIALRWRGTRAAAEALGDETLRAAFGPPPVRPPDARDSDGIVPTTAQHWGHIVHAAEADHLDVIGHFDDARHQPPHHDWLTSAAGFDRSHFDQLWDDVVEFMVEAARSAGPSR